MDLSSRLRSIVRNTPHAPVPGSDPALPGRRELTYEPDDGHRYEATLDVRRVAEILGGRAVSTSFGECLAIDRRYESDRWHGDLQIGDCTLDDYAALRVLDPNLAEPGRTRTNPVEPRTNPVEPRTNPVEPRRTPWNPEEPVLPNPIFIDLETTGLSGGAGTVAFLVGCGYFDCGAFQVRQFLLTSYASERALLAAVADFFGEANLIVTYNGKTFDVPVMETRWSFHRMRMPLDGVPHFDMLHPARRLWRTRAAAEGADEGGCRLSTLERMLMNVRRVGDVPGIEIPARFFKFLRTGNPGPLEPVLEHNRLDLVSLAAVTARALRLAREGDHACRDEVEALALGRVLERAGMLERAEACYRRAIGSSCADVKGEALYRLGIRCRKERRFDEAAAIWREVLALTEPSRMRWDPTLRDLRQFAVEALAIHHEHRAKDLDRARELATFALEETPPSNRRSEGIRHRIARLDRKLAKKKNAQLFPS